MKGWVWALLILGVWIAYKRDSTFASVVNRIVPGASGTLKSPLSSGFGSSVSGAARSGSTSPGSGQQTTQPALSTTFGVGNSGAGAGYTGIGVIHGGPIQKTTTSASSSGSGQSMGIVHGGPIRYSPITVGTGGTLGDE